MTKQEALKDLAGVLRDTPAKPPRVESGPAPLTPAQAYGNSNPTAAEGTSASSLLTQLLPSFTGFGSSAGGSSLLGELLGSGKSSPQGSAADALGLGLSPIISGLAGLFGGGGSKNAPPQLPLYSAPQRLQLQSSLQGGAVSGADSNQSGMPRANNAGSQPQITMHIQAMDTQSILNRSSDIAQAVRQAMLQSHPINDIVADL
jgi:hypothetical protein